MSSSAQMIASLDTDSKPVSLPLHLYVYVKLEEDAKQPA